MPVSKKNTIAVDGNDNITIQDVNGTTITINQYDQEEIIRKLNLLNKNQLKKLLEEMKDQQKHLSRLFIDQLHDIINQKNGREFPTELTLSVPRTRPDEIIGRGDDLEELHTLLSSEKRVVVVNGLGGIGKTTLAQVYVSKYYDEYEHIAWITQSSERIENDFINNADLIRNLHIDTAGTDPAQLFTEILRKLKSIEEKPNLLIIDNAEESLYAYLDKLPGQPAWHLLVTSREQIEGFYPKWIDFLSEPQAIQLFRKHYTLQKLSEQDIKDLITAVDYHTLTIEILAKTAQIQRYDAVILKQAIEKDVKANVRVSRDKGNKIEKVGSYLSTVFSLSKLNEEEIWLLKQFACLPPEFHAYDLLSELLLDEESTYKNRFAETLADISRRGWLFYDADKDSYKMHRIIAEVVKRDQPIGTEDVKPLVATLTQKLSVDQAKDNPIDKFVWIPFGRTLLANAKEDDSTEMIGLQNNMALRLQEMGDYKGAKSLLEKALQSAEKNYGTEHPNTATSYCNLAMMLRDLGDYQGAKPLLEKAVLSDEKNFGTEHPTTILSYSNLAMVLRGLGNYQRAKTLLKKAVSNNEKNFGTEHPITTVSYSNLALVLQDLGDYQEAKTLLEKAVLSDEKNFGTEHPYTAARYSNFATVLQNLGDYKGAKSLLEKALQSAEKNYGTEHPTTARSYSNLATVLQDLGDYQGAKTLLEKAVLSDEKNYGTENPYTAIGYSNLATVLGNLGDYQGAKTLLEKAVLIHEKNFGTEHPTTTVSYSNLALVLQDLGDYQEAKTLLEKAVLSDEKNFGTEHPTTILSYYKLATVLRDLGRYENALEFLDRVLIYFYNNLPEGHPYITNAYKNYLLIKQEMEGEGR